MSDVASLIADIIRSKRGDKSFALVFEGLGGDDDWFASIGNRDGLVSMGEAVSYGRVDFEYSASTPEKALQGLLEAVQRPAVLARPHPLARIDGIT